MALVKYFGDDMDAYYQRFTIAILFGILAEVIKRNKND